MSSRTYQQKTESGQAVIGLLTEIASLKSKQDALILAHYYQPPEIQAIADVVGDSYRLSQVASQARHRVLVVCGVRFMAESVALLSPDKTVILPELQAGCPMADSMQADDVMLLRRQYPQAAVVCYINTSAAVKAACDVSCTSANAVEICRRLPQQQIVFIPDPNLAAYVAGQLPEKHIIAAGGGCPAHQAVTKGDLERMRARHPDAPVLVHPECSPDIQIAADFVGSTAAIIRQVRSTDSECFIIGTEKGILWPLNKANPGKQFYFLTEELVCPDMKKIDLNRLAASLRDLQPVITVEPSVRARALQSLEKMLA